MRPWLPLLSLTLVSTSSLAVTAAGRDPADKAAQQWEALSIQHENMTEALQALINARSSEIVDLHSRLKWVLDNWVPNLSTPPLSK